MMAAMFIIGAAISVVGVHSGKNSINVLILSLLRQWSIASQPSEDLSFIVTTKLGCGVSFNQPEYV